MSRANYYDDWGGLSIGDRVRYNDKTSSMHNNEGVISGTYPSGGQLFPNVTWDLGWASAYYPKYLESLVDFSAVSEPDESIYNDLI